VILEIKGENGVIEQNLEKSVLASMMLGELEPLETGTMLLDDSCFQLETHKIVFNAICSIVNKNGVVDSITVSTESKIDPVDIFNIMETKTAPNIVHHCKELRDLSGIRTLVNMSTNVQSMAHSGEKLGSIQEMIDKTLMGNELHDDKYKVHHIKDKIGETFDAIEGRNNLLDPVFTGFKRLDDFIGGILPSEYVIIGARPGMGKTAFLLQVIMSISKGDDGALLFSMEMEVTQLVKRYLSSEGEVDGVKIRKKMFNKDDLGKMAQAANTISESNIFVNESPKLNCYEVCAVARRHVRKYPNTKVIVIDYLQLTKDTKEHSKDKRLANEEKSAAYRELSKELGIPVIALAQLSRACEIRSDHRPVPSDIKEAGGIEQDATLIMFLYRGFKYGDSYLDRFGESVKYKENDIDLIVAKHRDGSTGTIPMQFKGEYTKFYDVDFKEGEDSFEQETMTEVQKEWIV
jgi:replicative DNA helicase